MTNIMPAFTTTIKQNNINYNVTIAVASIIPSQKCHAVNASSDWDYFGENCGYEYVVYNMNNVLVESVVFDDDVIKSEISLYFERVGLYNVQHN